MSVPYADIGSWINRAAQAALCCSCLLPADAMLPIPPDSSSNERVSGHDDESFENEHGHKEGDENTPESPQNEILLSPGKIKSKSPMSSRGKSILYHLSDK